MVLLLAVLSAIASGAMPLAAVASGAAVLAACRDAPAAADGDPRRATARVLVPADTGAARLAYAGRDRAGVPHYVRRAFTPAEARLLRQVFGVSDPRLLYLSDSSATGSLKVDLARDRGRTDEVYSFSLGFVSLRRRGESWAAFRRRVLAMRDSDFPPGARRPDTSLALLDPAVRPLFTRMLRAARRRGFRVRVLETYRSPDREAYLLSRGDGRTYTATSLHSYGRAVDVRIGDGDVRHPATRRQYVAFRRWVLDFGRGHLKLIGKADTTWDWSHVEAPARWLGYHSIEAALAAARRCVGQPRRGGLPPCDFAPHLPPVERAEGGRQVPRRQAQAP